ncbi:DUF1775 domain-containing protein [Paenibacillus donghaensis]|uniref:YncI copper-binding domain-containing protein n=1 Tax=Paenibacillus donghaensis TaxID=414771 RepID=A0A2Z2K7A5_9BACL|nr:DUF1775 domain-containing protein [Paenibacillus donghaensis]ASA20854.1 hypothetical protein B9T62_08710 [Paenibacillus donghaensis]
MNSLLRKIKWLAAPAAALLLLSAAIASAHVTVMPSQSSTGAWETYTIKVPSEKDEATVQVDLRIPEGAEFKQYEPTPGWTVSVEGNKVSWKAAGEGILKDQFQRFYFTVKNPDVAGDIAWNAYQHYADGTVVQWSGEPGTETPHAITAISAAAAGEGGHGHGDMAGMDNHAEAPAAAAGSTSPLLYMTLGAALLALLLSIIALVRGRRA